MTRANTSDGGRTALCGYLYQIVGVWGFKAWAENIAEDPSVSELNTLLRIIRDGSLIHEQHEADAIIRSLGIETKDTCVLLQFKYSRQQTIPAISPGELITIVDQFNTSTLRVQAQDELVSKYVLITNRILGPGAETIIQDILSGRESQREGITSTQISIIKNLTILKPITFNDSLIKIQEFASRLGCLSDEIERGISTLVGKLVREAAEGEHQPITNEDLKEAFTEVRNCQPLYDKHEHMIQANSQGLQRFWEDRIDRRIMPIRRRILDEITRYANEHALIILYGDGGTGKTLGLWQWLKKISLSPQDLDGKFTILHSANDVSSNFVTKTICNWRNTISSKFKGEDSEIAMRRLISANPEKEPPIFYLGIDAIDEDTESSVDRENIRTLIKQFWDKEKAIRRNTQDIIDSTLIITCRDEKEFMLKWLGVINNSTSSEYKPPCIQITDFDDNELVDLSSSLNKDIHERFLPILNHNPIENTNSTTLIGIDSLNPFIRGISPSIQASLKHPVMWQSFLSLSLSLQERVLDEDKDALMDLSNNFVTWFCDKAMRRSEQFQGIDIRFILCHIAREHHRIDYRRRSRMDWITWAIHEGSCNHPEGAILYMEAMSSGLIQRHDKNDWRWRHQFVCDYLTSCEE